MFLETIYSTPIEFTVSERLESLRIPDYYSYLMRAGKLYSPVTGELVEHSITTRNSLEQIELDAFTKIQNWAIYSIGGSSVWISPPVRVDLSAKAVISEIGKDPDFGKILINRNICFDWDPELLLDFARYVGRNDIKTGEDFRGKPIFLAPSDQGKIYEFLERIEPRQVEQVKSGEDKKIKEEYKQLLAQGNDIPKGQYSPSCPGGAFEVFTEESFPCPKCTRPIPKGRGITTCPHCGAKKEDFNGGCD